MKKITILFALLAIMTLSAIGTTASAQSKVAYVDSETIVPEMAAYKRAKSEVEAYGKQLQKILAGKQAEMETYYKDVMTKAQQGLLTPKQQQEAEAKLQEMQANLQKEAQDADRKLMEKEQELTKPLYEQFNNAVAKVAKENGYHYVVDKKFMLYSTGGTDATAKIKTALGI